LKYILKNKILKNITNDNPKNGTFETNETKKVPKSSKIF
jgi:hypothetical protein